MGERGRWTLGERDAGHRLPAADILLRVYDQDGKPVPITDELADLADAQARQLAESERRLAALEAELRRLRGPN